MYKIINNFICEKQLIKLIKQNEIKRTFCNKRYSVVSVKYIQAIKINSFINNAISTRPVFQRNKNFSNKTPVVLLSGILTFLGLKQKTPEEKESELITTIKRGILCIQNEQFDKAEVLLHLALQLAQDQNDQDGVTFVYDTLANLSFETGQYEKAEKLFVNVLQRILAKGEAQDSNAVIHISLKLAKIFESTKDYKKAEQGYKFCIETLEQKLQGNDQDTLALWGMSMDWYARFLLGTNKKNEALDCLKKAYEMCVRVNGQDHEQTVVLLNDLGTISSLIGDTESALSYFEEAKKIGNKLPDMKDLASIYVNIGQLYLLREMYKESKQACEEGLKKAHLQENKEAFSEAQQCLESINKVFQGSGKTEDQKNTGKLSVK